MTKKLIGTRWRAALLAMPVLLATFPLAAQAEVTKKDFQVIARALSFVQNGPKGTVDIAIVHDPSNAASMADAQAAQNVLAGGFKAGALTLNPVMVPISDLGKVAGTGAIFVTTGTDAHHGAIQGASQSNGLVTITDDRGCVNSGKCAMFVASSPKVEIIVNGSAASALNITFDSAFRMMITEL